jgi:hypothetical protein
MNYDRPVPFIKAVPPEIESFAEKSGQNARGLRECELAPGMGFELTQQWRHRSQHPFFLFLAIKPSLEKPKVR